MYSVCYEANCSSGGLEDCWTGQAAGPTASGSDRRKYRQADHAIAASGQALILLLCFREEFLGDGIFNRDDEVSI